MSKQDILEIIRQTRPELADRFGVERLGLFGSYVREEEKRRSDIDLLVSFRRDIDLFEFLDLKEFLQERLHHKVDLVMDSALKPAIGKRIRAEVEYV
jgi:hypothetical protein